VLPLLALFLVARLVSPSGAVIVALAAGLALAFGLGLGEGGTFVPELSALVFVAPEFDPAVLIGVGLPLYLVTMAGQNLPGFAVLRASGFTPPSRSILATTGIASIVIALFGSHTANLGAITASICTGPDAHPDPAKRWLCGPFYAAGYIVIAALGASFVTLIGAMPPALIATIAGLALLGPLVNALGAALADAEQRLPATLTLVVTASGLALGGIGSAFWGLMAGLIALALQGMAERFRAKGEPSQPGEAAPLSPTQS
jgi:benzoate membrane transport protein